MRKKILKEQITTNTVSTGTVNLTMAERYGCFDNYKWFKKDTTKKQPHMLDDGTTEVVTGTNTAGDIIWFYSDNTLENRVKKTKATWSCSALPDDATKGEINGYLLEFGIPNDNRIYNKLEQLQPLLQKLVTSGSVGPDLIKFNEILVYYYPKDKTKRLTKSNGTELDIIDNDDLESNYTPNNLKNRYGINLIVYNPAGEEQNLVTGELKLNEESCRTKLKTYFTKALDYKAISDEGGYEEGLNDNQRKKYRHDIRMCKAKGFYDGFTITKKDLPLKLTKSQDPYKSKGFFNKVFGRSNDLSYDEVRAILNGIDIYSMELKENIKTKQNMLNKVIKKTLVETKENKKRLLQESKIVKTRFTMLMESSPLKTKKQVDDLYVNILAEMIYLHNQGFDNKLIAESVQGVFGVLSNLFGKSGGAIVDTFKEKGVNWILTKLGLEDNSYFKNFLITTLGNTNITDVPKLFTDCSFLTKKIAESIPEAYLRKLEYEKGLGGGISDVIRNTLYDVVRNSDFAQKLEASLAGLVCPVVSKMTSKFENKLSGMKSNLISPKNMKSSLVSLPFS